jgi:branched-chain amino acid transport system substrate-binding protein
VTLSLTGPASGLGIPVGNQFKLWPQTIAGEKVNLIILDDASDPSKGASNARRFVTDDKVDMIIGSRSPGGGRWPSPPWPPKPRPRRSPSRRWACRRARTRWAVPPAAGQRGDGPPIVEHMKKQGVKTVGFLGYTDAYGELWLKDFTAAGREAAGIKVVATERFARSDTSVTPQALKLVSANPDAMLVVASGSARRCRTRR